MIERVVELLNTNNIIFYKRDVEHGAIFVVPYTLIQSKMSLEIKLVIDIEHNYFVMGFECQKSLVEGLSDKLLNINARLKAGVLSVEEESNLVSYRINLLKEGKLDWNIYEEKLAFCIKLFLALNKEGLIDTEHYRVDSLDEE